MFTKITVENSQTDLLIRLNDISDMVSIVTKLVGVKANCINVYFLDAESVSRLHFEMFGDNNLTDCMSFPTHEKTHPPFKCDLLGETIISTLFAVNYAATTSSDPYMEIMTYLVHSILHLCGFRDDSSALSADMERVQNKALDFMVKCGFTFNPFHDRV